MNTFHVNLDELFKKYTKIVIVSHKNPDLDAYASSVGLYKILENEKKEVYIFLDLEEKYNSPVEDSIELFENITYINKNNYKDYVDDNTLWVILDTHCEDRLYYADFLKNTKNVAIIDHHIKSKELIKNYSFLYIDDKSSSVSEIITFYANYKGYYFNTIVSTILLAAIEIDTNSFVFKTTYNTFNACALLMYWGADNILKQEILKEDKEVYFKRIDYIRNSFMLNDKTAICILDNKIVGTEDLSAIAEEMLKFEDVAITFAIGKIDKNVIGISARSIGIYDMCKIMKLFGGGGHFNNAAAQIDNGKVKNIISTLEKALEEYL